MTGEREKTVTGRTYPDLVRATRWMVGLSLRKRRLEETRQMTGMGRSTFRFGTCPSKAWRGGPEDMSTGA